MPRGESSTGALIQIGARRADAGAGLRPRRRSGLAERVWWVASGKGGVGKSTVAVNLAVALAQRGRRVGVLDADVYGPSMPRLLQVQGERLRWTDDDRMIPAENFGVKVVSTGLATDAPDTPLAWRSAVATSALVQLLDDVDWGHPDDLIVDLPPGTGDVLITLAEELALHGVIVVTTPQPVATDDVRRLLRLLRERDLPIAGVVENMSFLVTPDTGLVLRPFGEGGGRILAEAYGAPYLGELPLDGEIRAGADAGHPIVAGGPPALAAPFHALAERLMDRG